MNEDRFADLLDELSNGITPTDTAPLASFARCLHRQHNVDHLDDERRASIRVAVLGAHDGGTPSTGGPGPLTQPALTDPAALNPWGARRRNRHPVSRRSQPGIVNTSLPTAITAMALAAIVIAALTAYPVLRRDSMPEVTPTAYAAAPTVEGDQLGQESAGPATLPSMENEWLTYIQPGECTVEPIDEARYATVVSAPTVAAPRAYGPLSSVDPDTAETVATTAREVVACDQFGTSRQRQALETDRHLYETQNQLASGLHLPTINRENVALGREVAETYRHRNPSAFIHVLDEEPPSTNADASVTEPESVFQPEHAVMLTDGRVAIPDEPAYWSGELDDPARFTAVPAVPMSLLVFEQAGGEWKLDEWLPFCVGVCEGLWDHYADVTQEPAYPDATPGMPIPPAAPKVVIPCPGGTPPWLTPIYPWELPPAPEDAVPTFPPEPWGPDDCAPVLQLSGSSHESTATSHPPDSAP